MTAINKNGSRQRVSYIVIMLFFKSSFWKKCLQDLRFLHLDY